MAIVGEAGVVFVDHNWKKVKFTKRLDSPVVVAKSPNEAGEQPVTVRIRNISQDGFEIRLQEYDYLDGPHSTAPLGWVAVQSGHQIDHGTGLQVDAGIVAISGTSQAKTPFMKVNFGQGFTTTPIVTSVVVSTNGAHAVTTRHRGVSRSGFELVLQEQESFTDGHVPEVVSYIAMYGPSNKLVAGSVNKVNHKWTEVGPIKLSFPAPMVVVADMQTYNGSNTAGLRVGPLDGGNKFRVRVQEEQSKDKETDHVDETVGYIVTKAGVF